MLRFITIGLFHNGIAKRGSRMAWRVSFRSTFITISTTPTSLSSDRPGPAMTPDSALGVLDVAPTAPTLSTTGGSEGATDGADKIYHAVAQRLRLPPACVRYVLEQTNRGATVPFLARYRRDETGGLDESALRDVLDTAAEVTAVDRRRAFMLRSLRDRGLLTDTLRRSLESLVHLSQLEDAWEPFKERRASLARRAREAGLAPLAERLMHTTESLDAAPNDAETTRLLEALILEELQRCEELRQSLLEECRRSTVIQSDIISTPRTRAARSMDAADFDALRKQFRHYANRRWAVGRINAHQLLAIQRGESKGVVSVRLVSHANARALFDAWVERRIVGARRMKGKETKEDPGSANAAQLLRGGLEAAYVHLVKATHTTIRRDLKKSAETEAVAVFARGLRHILLQCPMREARVLAMDPGFKHGVKCVALNENGGVLARFMCTISNQKSMKDYVSGCVAKLKLNKIVIGNGTASREVADIVAETIEERELQVEYAIVSEAGASVYSVSDVAKEEFPALDAMYRGAVSIGRRVIDPLSELVKIPVRSMGIGMYQHDVSEAELLRALHRVVESCVASVGVNIMSSNRYMMEKIPGVTRGIVDQIVLARHAGRLQSREDLRRIPGMTEAAFQQIAGFFRFPNSPNPLDNSNIHPESYSAVQQILDAHAGKNRSAIGELLISMTKAEAEAMATRIGCGRATLELVARELVSPALDPRSELPHVGLFRRAPRRVEDLRQGDELVGAVRNVTPFGVFVDVGLHEDVLVRGVDVDRIDIGSVMSKLQYQGSDDLGRLLVRYTGTCAVQKSKCREGLAMESADLLKSHSGKKVEELGDSEAWWRRSKATNDSTNENLSDSLKNTAASRALSASKESAGDNASLPEKTNRDGNSTSLPGNESAGDKAPSASQKKKNAGKSTSSLAMNSANDSASLAEKESAGDSASSLPEKDRTVDSASTAKKKKKAADSASTPLKKKKAADSASTPLKKKKAADSASTAKKKRSGGSASSLPEKESAGESASSLPEKESAGESASSLPEKESAGDSASLAEKESAGDSASLREKESAGDSASLPEKESSGDSASTAKKKKSSGDSASTAKKKSSGDSASTAKKKKSSGDSASTANKKKSPGDSASTAKKKNSDDSASTAKKKKISGDSASLLEKRSDIGGRTKT